MMDDILFRRPATHPFVQQTASEQTATFENGAGPAARAPPEWFCGADCIMMQRAVLKEEMEVPIPDNDSESSGMGWGSICVG
jgi:hypothetical protein